MMLDLGRVKTSQVTLKFSLHSIGWCTGRWVLVSGDKVLFWKDRWIKEPVLGNLLPWSWRE